VTTVRPAKKARRRRRSTRPADPGGDVTLADGAELTGRRCIVTGTSGPKGPMIRFVITPDGGVVADLTEKLLGRGIWLSASRDAVLIAVKRKLFSRAARCQVSVPEGLADQLEAALVDRAVAAVGMARRSGLLVAGNAKVEAALRQGQVLLRLEAQDGSAEGRRKLDNLSPGVPVLEALTTAELARAFDRERTAHAAVFRGKGTQAGPGLVTRLTREFERLAGFRSNFGGAGLEKTVERCIEPIEPTAEIIGQECAVTE
jgi:predicted RNA-binding protein YlxR (DUF448 family)